MKLTNYKIGDLVTPVDERNVDGLTNFYGININKEFMPTAANTEGLDESNYKVVRKNRFVFSGMQTGRDGCIRISMYSHDEPIIVSPAYITFEVTNTEVIIPSYFFMLFLSKEKDRLGAFYSDGSIRSNLDWDRFCDIELTLPDKKIQEKFVDIYNALCANQQSYERGLEDLKLVCDAYIEQLRRDMTCESLEGYIEEVIRYVGDSTEYSSTDILGISSIEKRFMETKANTTGLSLESYKIVCPNEFSFNPNTARMGDRIPIALNDTGKDRLVSAIYPVFKIKKDTLIPEYLMMWFKRAEFDRYARFNSWGSAREVFNYRDFQEVKIPIPSLEIQKSIVSIFNIYTERKSINEKLVNKLKEICPVLIRGSVESRG